ncbi:MAG: hypothetical protein IJU03_06765 [Thermoguttaceae bacterium]|nr:hypothetical protein [Thermoguttaceae bacterium]
MRRFTWKTILSVAILCGFAGTSFAAPQLFSGRSNKVEADVNKDYVLQESDGRWFIMAKKFSGEGAARQAKRLVYELRASQNLPAFVFKYDPDKMDMDALSSYVGASKRFHYQTARAPEYAVLVGSFPTGEDPGLQKTLETIRKMQPRALKDDPQSQAIAAKFKADAKRDPKLAGYGPLGGATPVPNPLLPKEYFNHKGVVDGFVAKLNSDSPYSLLNNKKMYTVRIATFSGDSNMSKSSDVSGNLSERLQYAGLRAAALCEALRNSNVEAWEFHDRDCSFVTIGGFDSYGTLQEDGHIELNPQIGAIMKKFGGELVNDGSGTSQYKAYTIEVEIPDPESTRMNPKKKRLSIACDVRPVIIMVPQRSGEENVQRIALAQEQLELVKKQKVAQVTAAALHEAEMNLESVRSFANSSQALTEEELKKLDPKIFAAMQASKRQEGQPKAQPAPTSPNYAQQAQPNPTQAAPIRANAATVPQRVAASPAPRPAATPQPAPVATRPANAPRRQAAPTY